MKNIRFKDYLKDYLDYNNITNKDFANRICVTSKHLIDIMSGKEELSSNLIQNISLVTGISANYIYKIESNYKFEKEIYNYLDEKCINEKEYLDKFKYKFLIEKNWIDFIDKNDKTEIIKDILKYLRVPNPQKVYDIDKNILYKSSNDKPELLLLWLEKCFRETQKQKALKYEKENIDILVKFIKEEAMKNFFNQEKLISKFNENGIFLVIQEDIPGSKIRGAFKVHKNKPAIYITYKHMRIADIYFALLHELAHCKTDFNKAKSINLVSYENEVEESEFKADEQAYNWMVDKTYYDRISKDFNYNIAKEETYPKSFIAYRFAKDKIIEYSSKIYQENNILLEMN